MYVCTTILHLTGDSHKHKDGQAKGGRHQELDRNTLIVPRRSRKPSSRDHCNGSRRRGDDQGQGQAGSSSCCRGSEECGTPQMAANGTAYCSEVGPLLGKTWHFKQVDDLSLRAGAAGLTSHGAIVSVKLKYTPPKE